MRNLVKIGSGMCDPDPDVLVSIQNIFISNERLRSQATVLRVLEIFGCLFLQIYLLANQRNDFAETLGETFW